TTRRRRAATSSRTGTRTPGSSAAVKPDGTRGLLPEPLFTRAILIRAAVLWLGVRMMIAFRCLLGGGLRPPTGVPASALIVAATVFLAGVELRRRNEFLFLGSLGYGPTLLLAVSALPIVPLEVLFTLVLP